MTENEKQFREFAETSERQIRASAMFISIYSKSYHQDAMCALQLGMAVMMDKPIYLLLERGQALPAHLKRIARKVEEFAPGDEAGLERATKALCDAAAAEIDAIKYAGSIKATFTETP